MSGNGHISGGNGSTAIASTRRGGASAPERRRRPILAPAGAEATPAARAAALAPAACTIIARNYLSHARILAESWRRHEPAGRFYLLSVDGLPEGIDPGPGIQVVDARDLRLPHFHELAFKYDVTELCTAVKPALLLALLNHFNEEHAIYFDPDILICRELVELKERLSTGNIVLTPHLLHPIPLDGLKPTETDILRDGTFNLGFIGVRRSEQTLAFLNWWDERLRDGCRMDPANGMFTDQKWIDLVPSLYPGVQILADDSYNVAYWNIHARDLTQRGQQYYVNGRKLSFYHFSGFNPTRPEVFSKHQTRTHILPGSPLAQLLDRYVQLQFQHGYAECSKWKYAYARLSNDVALHPLLRQLYLNLNHAERQKFPNPFSAKGAQSFYYWAVTPGDEGELSPFLQLVYQVRYDVADAFPDVKGKHRKGFLQWARTQGSRELGYDPRLVLPDPAEVADAPAPPSAANPAAPRSAASPAAPQAPSSAPAHPAPADAASRHKLPGVNVVGYLRNESGLGAAARGYIRALRRLDAPLSLRDVSSLSINRSQDTSLNAFDETCPHPINLICVNSDQHFNTANHLGKSFFEGKHNIGIWAWELPRFPDEWKDRFPHYQEIWAGTSFVANALSAVSPIPVVRVPPVLTASPEHRQGSRQAGRDRLNVGNAFLFAFAFDFHSFFQRKNPLAIIDAFKQAFSPGDPVRLIIKSVNSKAHPQGLRQMQAKAEGYPIDIHDGYWPANHVSDLMAAVDCYVSLHRSEGTGLTLSEAMGLGKPVIATGWSGNMDFMSVANSFPVGYRLVHIEEDMGPYKAGETWAEPSIDDAAEKMRYVFTHRAEAAERGLLAQRDIETHFSEAAVAKLIEDRLSVIGARLGQPAAAPIAVEPAAVAGSAEGQAHSPAAVSASVARSDKKKKKMAREQYRAMVAGVIALVKRAAPPEASVAVVSRGDPRLLDLGRRRASHFPQGRDGSYAGFYPSDSNAAVAHLQGLVKRGLTHIVFPQSAAWWLEHYQGLADYLAQNATVAASDETGTLYELQAVNDTETTVAADSPNGSKPMLYQASRVRTAPGINLVGHITSEKGVGEGVRSDLRALEAAGVSVALNNFEDSGSHNRELRHARLSQDNPHPINLVHLNPDQLPQFEDARGRDYFRGKYNIGYWAWELSRFPQELTGAFDYFEEIWVPSSFALEAVSRVSPIPVRKMPHALEIPDKKSAGGRDTAADKFMFLYMFDFHSQLERKNPLGLIKAFKKAFKKSDNAVLVLKTAHSTPALLSAMQKMCRGADIRIVDSVMSREQVNALLSQCDCYVSPHRAEGFGLTIAEAMSHGVPVIATAYSGNMDFTTPSNSFLIRYELTTIDRDHGPYKKGYVWADPDIDHAAELMRYVYDHPAAARKVAARGRADVTEQFSPQAVGQLMRHRLEKVMEERSTGGDKSSRAVDRMTEWGGETSADQTPYAQLVARIRKAVEQAIGAGQIIAVVNRGDPELLKFSERTGWNFPQTTDGGYAGFYPPDSDAAAAHVEAVRARGARYLLFPQTAFWWLDHYGQLRTYLEKTYRLLVNNRDCVLYELASETVEGGAQLNARLDFVAGQIDPLLAANLATHRRLGELEQQFARIEARLGTMNGAIEARLAEIDARLGALNGVAQSRFVDIDSRFNHTDEQTAAACNALQQRNDELAEKSASLEARVEELTARLAAAPDALATLDQRVANLVADAQTERTAFEARIAANETRLDHLELRQDPAEQRLDSVEKRLDPVEQRVDLVEKRQDPVEQLLDRLEKRLDPVEQRVDLVEKRQDPVEEHLDRLEKRVDPLEHRVDLVEKRQDPVEEHLDRLEKRVDPLEQRLDPLEQRLDLVEKRQDPVERRLEQVAGHVAPIELRLDRCEQRQDAGEKRLDAADALHQRVSQHLEKLDAHVAGVRGEVLGAEAKLAALQAGSAELENVQKQAASLSLEQFEAVEERFDTVGERIQYFQQSIEDTAREINAEVARRHGELSAHLKQLTARLEDAVSSRVESRFLQVENRVDEAAGAMEAQIVSTSNRLQRLENRLGARPYISTDIFNATGDLTQPMGYDVRNVTFGASADVEFADVFRGSEALITERQAVYLPFFKKRQRIIDLAPGRGEFLSVLRNNSLSGVGVDADPRVIEALRVRGLDGVQGDPIEYLRGLAERSVDGIFCPQRVQDLSPEQVQLLLSLAKSRLREGGVLALETVNPENFEAMKVFHVDPGHLRPIFPQVLLMNCRTAGFPSARVFYPFNGGFTQQEYSLAGEYAVIAVA